ncbi:MAG: hypothetical protein Ct9H300mP14_08410 [Gammaproteobacteria bacterium]|nr:MAG: hypothetical protein Ct9H300mP14_08410 [Gammaproteobacteria bacterium]
MPKGFLRGGHRATFSEPYEKGHVGTLALVPQIVDAVSIPVIAAGGIGDGRGIAAALALGASAVQLGTAFLTCPESAAHPLYGKALMMLEMIKQELRTHFLVGQLEVSKTDICVRWQVMKPSIRIFPS